MRMRTGIEHLRTKNSRSSGDKPSVDFSFSGSHHRTSTRSYSLKDKCLSDFQPNLRENLAFWELKEDINAYIVTKVSIHKKDPNKIFLGLQDYFSVIRPTHTQKSNVKYHRVMDAVADSKDTMTAMLYYLHQQYISRSKHKYLVVEGDAKLFEIP